MHVTPPYVPTCVPEPRYCFPYVTQPSVGATDPADLTVVGNELFFTAVQKHMLADGAISAAEARWLRKMIFADGTIDENEKKLMQELKAGAREL